MILIIHRDLTTSLKLYFNKILLRDSFECNNLYLSNFLRYHLLQLLLQLLLLMLLEVVLTAMYLSSNVKRTEIEATVAGVRGQLKLLLASRELANFNSGFLDVFLTNW